MNAASALAAFADDVGGSDPVTAAGGRTQWDVGGTPSPDGREVRAPSGIVEYEPAEMVIRCLAGTTVAEIDAATAAHGQMVPLDPQQPDAATVGGVLAVGHSGIRRLRYGPVRDLLLQTRFVNAAGALITAGGPVVKNVSGFDLCRLLVGSLGTLGLFGEVVLRVYPRPVARAWYRGHGVPLAVLRRLFRPASVLWDGDAVWVLLEGRPADVAAEQSALGVGFEEVDGPPAIPRGGRLSRRPSELAVDEPFVAEIGVGTIHVHSSPPPRPVEPPAARLHRDIKSAFDPEGRLNPGRKVFV